MFIGGNLISGVDARETIRAVSERRHPAYNEDTTENDFMLVKLQQRSTAPSIPWNTDRVVPATGQATVVIGFGTTSENGNISAQLKETSLNIVDFGTCSAIYDNLVDQTMICAYKPNTDSCQGDR